MSTLLAAPLLVPLSTALLCAASAGRPVLQRAVSTAGSGLLLATGCILLLIVIAQGPQSVVFGNWPAPFGIVFQVDRLAALLVFVSSLLGGCCLLYLNSGIDPPTTGRYDLQPALIHLLMAGVCAAFCTADLFNLYVWFELMLMATLGLFVHGKRTADFEAGLSYLMLNLLGTLLLLLGIANLYASTGQLAFASLAPSIAALPTGQATLLLSMLALALLLKAGAVPLHAWLGASYPALPIAVLALIAGLLTKVGVYALLRLADPLFPTAAAALTGVLGTVALATMLVGVLGAAYHWDLRRILAFHIVSQIGYILLALALGGPAGQAIALFYTMHHILVKANLFLIAGLICLYCGSFDLRRCGGLLRSNPWLAVLFAVPALSLVGLPPFSGFWAKWLVLDTSLSQTRFLWAGGALLVSVLTLYSMLKVWLEAFCKPMPSLTNVRTTESNQRPALAWMACILLTLSTLAISLHPEPWLQLSGITSRYGPP